MFCCLQEAASTISSQRIADTPSWQQQPPTSDQPVHNLAAGSHHLPRLGSPSFPDSPHNDAQELHPSAKHGSLAQAQSRLQLRLPARHGSLMAWQT